jgi:hypothetical protein
VAGLNLRKEVRMNDKEIELIIPIDQFCNVLGLCEDHRAEKLEVFKVADSLRVQDGEEYFSVTDYARYVHEQLDSSWEGLTDIKSASAFAHAESMAVKYLVDWTSILTWLLSTAVGIEAERKDYFDVGFKATISNFQSIFDRLKSIFEFVYDLAYTGRISRKDENLDSPE